MSNQKVPGRVSLSIDGLITICIAVVLVTVCISVLFHKKGIQNQYNRLKIEFSAEKEKARQQQEAMRKQLDEEAAQHFLEKLTSAMMEIQPRLDEGVARRIAVVLICESEKSGFDPALLVALIFEESSIDPMATSKKGAIGLMQVRYEVWKDHALLLDNGADALNKLYRIETNIKCGVAILRHYYNESEKDIAKTLHRYHSGSTDFPRGKKYYEIDYVNKVLIRAQEVSEMIKD